MKGSAVSLAGHSRTPCTSRGSPGAEWAKEVKTNVIVMTTRSATVLFIAAPPDRARSRISVRRRSIARYSGAAALTGGPVSPLIASPIMVARARFDVTGRTCLVTGAGRGIGRATAEAFASAGARVTVADVDEASAKSVADGIAATGGQACAIGLDVGSAISVNAVAPTHVRTEMTRARVDDEEYRARLLARTPLGRVLEPDDVVGALLFLASPAADSITGHVLAVDGGWLAE